MKVVADEYPRLVLVALKNIQMFEEIRYDYKAPIRDMWWRENVSAKLCLFLVATTFCQLFLSYMLMP